MIPLLRPLSFTISSQQQHDSAVTLQDRSHRILAVAALVFLPFTAWSRDISVAVLTLAALAVLCDAHVRRTLQHHDFVRVRGAQIGLALVVWATAATLWAPHHPWSAWLKAFLLVVFTGVVVLGLGIIPTERLRRFAPLVTSACGGLFLLLLIERATGGFFIHLERATSESPTLYNVLSGGLALLCSLAFCAAYFLWRKTKRRALAVGFVAACFVLSLAYRMDAAPFALAIGAICFLLVRQFGRRMFALLGLALVLVTLGWGAAASLAWSMDAQAWLLEHGLNNWAARIVIWHGVAELIVDNPIVGYGFDSARIVGQGAVEFLHPHNGLLQVWLELGLVGVALLYSAGGAAAKAAMRAPPNPTVLATVAATVVTYSVFWSISFGIWQGWYVAVAGLTICAMVLVYRIEDQSVA